MILIRTINTITKDKWMHVCVSAVLAVTIKNCLRPFMNEWYSVLIAFGVTIIIGIGKEVYDKLSGKGTPELKDFIADVLGAVIGSM